MKRLFFAAALVAAFSLPASAQIQLTQIARVNVGNVTSFGNQLASVAWNGSSLVVGGYRNNSDTQTSMILFSGITANPVSYSYTGTGGTGGTQFGAIATSASRGFNQLALSNDGKTVYAAWDNGVASGSSIQAWNISGATPTKQWFAGDAGPGAANTALRGNGVAIDPGFNGTGASAGNVSITSAGNGRNTVFAGRTTTSGSTTFQPGQVIYNQTGYTAPVGNPAPLNSGSIITYTTNNGPAAGNTFRGLAYDSAGNRYVREQNRVVAATRTGDNATGTPQVIYQPTSSPNTTLQSIAYAMTGQYGDLLFFNDAPDNTTVTYANAADFSANSPIKAINTAGLLQTLNFDFGAFGTPGESSKQLSFSFDAVSQTLAIGEFGTGSVPSRVSIFRVGSPVVVPEAGTTSLFLTGGLGLIGLVLRKRKA